MSIAEKIIKVIGPAVLLSIPPGEKGPKLKAWQKLTLANMSPEYLAGLNHGDNIGVSLGEASEGLCTIDCDSDALLEGFLEANPALRGTLITRGKRGGNLWVRIEGDYPKSCALRLQDRSKAGEWRASGNQTVIYGRHPSGVNYKGRCKNLAQCEFSAINWPPELTLPWARPDAEETEAPPQQEQQDETAEVAIPEGLILLPGGPVGNLRSAETVFSAIAQGKPHTIFIRSGSVVKIVTAPTDDRVDPQEDGALRIQDIKADELRSEIERHGTIFAYRTGPHGELHLKAGARMSRDVATMLLTSEPRFRLPKLAIIHACPLLIQEKDGAMRVLGRGYHPYGGGRFITGGKTVPQISLADAVGCLLSMLEEFDFVTPADKSRAIAAILSPALRMGGLLNCHLPILAFEADKTQSGKGYLLSLIHCIYNEIPSMLFNRKGGVGGFDEDLSQALVKGHPFVQIDNIRSAIDSQFLEMMMTCELNGEVSARTPYRPATYVNPHRFILQLTSNSYDATADLSARSSIVRIRKKEGYAFRKFAEGDLLAHVGANQPRYLGAVFVVAARWVLEGRPRTDDVRGEGRFQEWAQSLDWIVQNICRLRPLMDGHQEPQRRTANPALSWLRGLAIQAGEQNALGQELPASRLVEMSEDAELSIPGVRDDADERKKAMRVGIILKNLFSESPKLRVDSFIVERVKRNEYQEAREAYYDAKYYVFTAG